MSTPAPESEPNVRVRVRRGGRRRAIMVRTIVLIAAGIGFYYLWPQLVEFFDAIPSLATIRSFWFVLMLLLEAASFACYWGLMRITTGERRWSVVALAQLASTAFSRVVPGGAASGGAANYQMFTAAGAPRGRVATGVTAASLLSTAVLFVLPVFALPAIIAGAPISRGLLRGLEFGLVMAALIVAGGAGALFTDGPVRWVGRAVQRVLNRRRTPTRRRHDLPDRLIEERDLIKSTLGGAWWQALLFSAGNWLLDFAALVAAIVAVGAQPRPSLVLLAYVVAALLAVIPLTPGGLGFVEVGLVAMLGLAGVGAAEATTAVLAYRLVSFWLPIPAGLVSWLVFRHRYGGATDAEGVAS
jgi:uncharacterized protein (TIRG00374 family)